MTETSLNETFNGKKILVTGATGSIGSELVRNLLELQPAVIRLYSNDENSLFEIQNELNNAPNLRFFVGDVREKERLHKAAQDIDIIFHVAALKHVPLCEYNPFEAVKTNVIGTQNLLEIAIDQNVDKVITISTDKAVNPVNVMGATKLLAERLTIAANNFKGSRKTVMSCVRFGNVLASRGSVIPLFKSQIQKGGPVTLTDPEMFRFVMSTKSAIRLVLKSAQRAKGGEVFIFKMPTICISDLAQIMIEELAPKYGYNPKNIEIKIIGKRSGERSYEELMTEDEAMHAIEVDDMFVIPPPQSRNVSNKHPKKHLREYNSKVAKKLTKPELTKLLSEYL